MKKIKPWITFELIKSIRHRDQLKKKLIQTRSEEAVIQYKQYRNKLNSLLHQTKNNYYKTKIEQVNNNYKHIWSIVNEVTNDKNDSKKISSIKFNDKLIVNNVGKANASNNFFINVGKEMSQKISPIQEKFSSKNTSRNSNPITENDTYIMHCIFENKLCIRSSWNICYFNEKILINAF